VRLGVKLHLALPKLSAFEEARGRSAYRTEERAHSYRFALPYHFAPRRWPNASPKPRALGQGALLRNLVDDGG
jgi:hypothetical protein